MQASVSESSSQVLHIAPGTPATPATEELPTSPLLGDNGPPQYATYRAPMGSTRQHSAEGLLHGSTSGGDAPYGDAPYPEEKQRPWAHEYPPETNGIVVRPWTPIPLRKWFWIPLVLTMALGGVAFEIALHFSEKNQGWETKGKITTESGFMHYVYTLPPVAISMFFAALWAWTDLEIRKLQPYVELARGNAPPQRSLLLDYTRTHTFFVWTVAARNQHWLVVIGALLVVLTLAFQPLAAALFNVQDIDMISHGQAATNLGLLSLNNDANFQDLTSFLTAAGYASASVLYNITDPPFVHNGYTVAPLTLSENINNGTMWANTTAVYSHPSCMNADAGSLNMAKWDNSSGWTNSASFEGCEFSWSVNKSATNLFGVELVTNSTECTVFTSVPEPFRPIIFWFFTYQPTPMASLTLCTPNITLLDVSAAVDLASGALAVAELGPLGSHTGALAQDAGNVTRAYNGMFFALDSPDPFVAGRQDAIRLALPAAVFQAAQAHGLVQAFQDNEFAGLAQRIYTMYLSLVAKTVYFLPATQPMHIDLQTVHKRLFLSPVATHLLAAAMFVLALAGSALQLWHARERRVLRLAHAPGTIASAVSLGGGGVGGALAGRTRAEDMRAALHGKRFRIDRGTGRIVVEGERGFEQAATPASGRLAFGEAGPLRV
ncbi:DUF3433 domain-containing protein [Phanerochaete sordida]|uniref:DUF3433 domain-containing protein n=1 Tax=Phanerochaete sordida TaxID=48140 RepID=A0A9P3L8T2_9APHY|nr:DUF3433 domain-containing protein [Phanerochaete sordida]